MKDTIFYFTGTGNSLAVAKKLAEQGGFELVAIASLRNVENLNLDCERVGLIFPLYFTGLPLIVKAFIRKLEFQNKPYIFAVVTCGFTVFSYALHGVKAELKKKGQQLAAGFTLPMVDNYLPIYHMPKEEELGEVKKRVDEKVRFISDILSRREEKIEREGLPIFHPLYLRTRKLHDIDKDFNVSDACNGCGICEKVCPVDNITMKDGKPDYLHRCEYCLACIQHCPKTAIVWKNKTQGKGRYRNSEVSLKEIMAQKTFMGK